MALESTSSLQRMLAANDAFTDILYHTFRESCVQCHGQKDKIKGDVNLFELHSKEALMPRVTLMRHCDPTLVWQSFTAMNSGYLLMVAYAN